MRLTRLVPIALALVTAMGCSSSDWLTGIDRSTVRLHNTSSATLTDVRITTGPTNSDVIEATLAPGQTSSEHVVESVWGGVSTRATVDGQPMVALLIEGFAEGFNGRLRPGRYDVVIKLVPFPPPQEPQISAHVVAR